MKPALLDEAFLLLLNSSISANPFDARLSQPMDPVLPICSLIFSGHSLKVSSLADEVSQKLDVKLRAT